MADSKKKIVAKDFFCIKTKVTYKKGDEYKGDRTDLDHLMEKEIAPVKKEEKKKF